MCAVRTSSSRSLENLESRLLLAAGDVDATFAGGQIIRDILGGDDFAFAVAVQGDGKVLVAGRARTSSTTGNDFALLRFNPDGTPDSTFGAGGLVTTDLGSTSDSANAIVIQPDGKILLAGETRRSSTLSDFALMRYNPDGTLDTSFGTGGSGKVITDFSLGTDQAKSVALAADGRIVVAGFATVSGRTRVALARYTSAGVLDTSFGSGGKVSTLFIPGTARANSIALLSDGSILVAGNVLDFSTSAQDWVAMRYSVNGVLDSGFGAGGWARIDMGGDLETASSLLVQSDGRIILAGDNSDSVSGTSDFALARLLSDGMIDSSFGDSGRVLADFAGEFDQATSATLQADGKIVVAGLAGINGTSCFGVRRFDPDGAADVGFATNGLVMLSFGAGDVANAVAVDHAARLVVAGFTMDSAGDFDFALTRLLGNTPPLANAGSGYVVTAGQSVTLDGSASSDPDGAIIAYEWDFDYDGHLFDADASGATVSFSAAGLLAPSTRTVALRVTDNQGATHIATASVTVLAPPQPQPQPEPDPQPQPGSVVLLDDPEHPGMKVLLFTGTPKSDHVKFLGRKGSIIEVRLNGNRLGCFANVSRIVGYGDDGNDILHARRAHVPVELFGGRGHDLLMGWRLNDILVGGDGNDHLFGAAGSDLIVGGLGRDTLHGVLGDDLLVGGAMRLETDPAALRSVLADWTNPELSLRDRVSRLLETSAVMDDMARDHFFATPGRDMLFTGEQDKVHVPKQRRVGKK